MAKRTCSIIGCDRPHEGLGWCHLHYARWKTHGDPLKTLVPRGDYERRFREKLQITESGCHEWMEGRDENGYGRFWVNGRSMGAHRFAWELINGPIPHGICVCHHCDNPPCCNVEHLFIGTHQDNQDDKVAKNRQAVGEDVGTSVLTEDQVRQIKSLYVRGSRYYGTPRLARRFGVSQRTVWLIVNDRFWRSVK